MDGVPAASVAPGDQIARAEQDVEVEEMPHDQPLHHVEFADRRSAPGPAQPVAEELLTSLDAQMQPHLALGAGREDGTAYVAPVMSATDREQQHRGVEDEWCDRGPTLIEARPRRPA